MTVRELHKRNDKAHSLRVIEVGEGNYFVESSTGKVAYKCRQSVEGSFCTCGDFQKNAGEPGFMCKHLLAVSQCANEGENEKRDFLKRRQPKLNQEFIKSIEGKDFVTYQGLLDLAHQRGLTRIEVEIVQNPTVENQHAAIVRAVAESKLGEVFSDVGDANPNNTNSKVSKHLLRMASTRAKARCLRDLTNIGMTCLEELADLNEVMGDNGQPGKVTPLRRKGNGKPAEGNKTPEQRQGQNQNVRAQAKNGNPQPSGEAAPSQGNQQNHNAETPAQAATGASNPNPSANTGTPAKNDNATGAGKARMSEAQNRAIANLSRRRGLSMEQVGAMSLEMFGLEMDHLSAVEASSLIRHLQQAA